VSAARVDPSLLLVGDDGDPVVAGLAELARAGGRAVTVAPPARAARMFSVACDGARATVEPAVPMLLRAARPRADPRDEQARFHADELAATLWAAGALSPAPVVNRPGPNGWAGGLSASAAVTERRAGVDEGRAETFATAPPGDGGWWVEDAGTRRVAVSPDAPGPGPFRMRPAAAWEGYELVAVVGDRAWRSTALDLGGLRLEPRSVAACRALGLQFAAVTWGIEPRAAGAAVARIDAFPTAEQLRPCWPDVARALLALLTP
jgi:hypothetical protein